MLTIKPFRGYRPVADKVDEVASPPYDVLNSDEARKKAKNNPLSFLHVVKPEIDCEPNINVYDSQVYQKGSENLQRLIRDGILVQDDVPCYYIYKLRMGDHVQCGLVTVASVVDYIEGRIKKHENTRPEKEQDRVNHIQHLNAQTGPVFLTYPATESIDHLIEQGMESKPEYHFKGDHDVDHTFYVIRDSDLIEQITEQFKMVDSLYVADGHHRSAAATRVYEAMKSADPDHDGREPYNYFLSVIFPDSQMQILSYNRVVTDLNGLTVQDFITSIEKNFEVMIQPGCCCGCIGCDGETLAPEAPHQFGMYLEGQWFTLTAKETTFDPDDPITSLDVSILQENLLSPILGIDDPRTDNRIQFVGGIRGLEELEKLVNERQFMVAFSLYPTGIDQLIAVADAGKVMPPKSTWFEPKLRSGIVVHVLGSPV